MKKAIAIIVFGLLWCNVGFAKDLTGIIISCKGYDKDSYPKKPARWNHLYIKFISKHQARVIQQWGGFYIMDKKDGYSVSPKEIKIGDSIQMTINRIELSTNTWRNCKMIEDENFDIKKDIEERTQEALETQERLNKI